MEWRAYLYTGGFVNRTIDGMATRFPKFFSALGKDTDFASVTGPADAVILLVYASPTDHAAAARLPKSLPLTVQQVRDQMFGWGYASAAADSLVSDYGLV